MDNPEETSNIGTQDSRRKQTKRKHNTVCVGHHYSQASTNNVNKTWALLQTTGGKDEKQSKHTTPYVLDTTMRN